MKKKVLLVAVSTIKKKLLPTKKQILDGKRWKQSKSINDEDNEKATNINIIRSVIIIIIKSWIFVMSEQILVMVFQRERLFVPPIPEISMCLLINLSLVEIM